MEIANGNAVKMIQNGRKVVDELTEALYADSEQSIHPSLDVEVGQVWEMRNGLLAIITSTAGVGIHWDVPQTIEALVTGGCGSVKVYSFFANGQYALAKTPCDLISLREESYVFSLTKVGPEPEPRPEPVVQSSPEVPLSPVPQVGDVWADGNGTRFEISRIYALDDPACPRYCGLKYPIVAEGPIPSTWRLSGGFSNYPGCADLVSLVEPAKVEPEKAPIPVPKVGEVWRDGFGKEFLIEKVHHVLDPDCFDLGGRKYPVVSGTRTWGLDGSFCRYEGPHDLVSLVEPAKVEPTAAALDVKVGQVWADGNDVLERVTEVTDDTIHTRSVYGYPRSYDLTGGFNSRVGDSTGHMYDLCRLATPDEFRDFEAREVVKWVPPTKFKVGQVWTDDSYVRPEEVVEVTPERVVTKNDFGVTIQYNPQGLFIVDGQAQGEGTSDYKLRLTHLVKP